MRDVVLLAVVIAYMLGGFYIVSKIDRFLDDNRNNLFCNEKKR